jgi:CDP-glucose 4,6-dehydratase
VEDVVSIGGAVSFGDAFRGKRVLVTGNTGFKGSWLTVWLLKLGAKVIGVARDVPTEPAMFNELGLRQRIGHHTVDVRDLPALRAVFAAERPEFVFHLAAQAIVSTSYRDPAETISTNVIGTMNVLECLRLLQHECHAVLITSDKCYDNVEWVWGYRETDHLGGKDVYSGSKGAAELVIRSYVHSFMMKADFPVRVAVARAGNVIGGGDWANDRIVADCMRAWSQSQPVEIRSPSATRPWQHVLEPLSGYLTLAHSLAGAGKLHGEAFNFGPRAEQNRTVVELLTGLAQRWGLGAGDAFRVTGNIPFHEAELLKLNCDKALFHLGWYSTLAYEDTIRYVGDWYREFYRGSRERMAEFTTEQVESYESAARARGLPWASR